MGCWKHSRQLTRLIKVHLLLILWCFMLYMYFKCKHIPTLCRLIHKLLVEYLCVEFSWCFHLCDTLLLLQFCTNAAWVHHHTYSFFYKHIILCNIKFTINCVTRVAAEIMYRVLPRCAAPAQPTQCKDLTSTKSLTIEACALKTSRHQVQDVYGRSLRFLL